MNRLTRWDASRSTLRGGEPSRGPSTAEHGRLTVAGHRHPAPEEGPLNRILVIGAVVVAAAAIATAAVSAASGAAARPSAARTLQLTFQSTFSKTFEQAPQGESAGDLSVFGGTLRSGGKAVGRFQADCVHLSAHHSQCSLTGVFHGDQVTAVPAYGKGFSGTQPVARYPITGGTGSFQNARGYIVEQDTGPASGRLTVHLTGR
jgi:hypothetical protein